MWFTPIFPADVAEDSEESLIAVWNRQIERFIYDRLQPDDSLCVAVCKRRQPEGIRRQGETDFKRSRQPSAHDLVIVQKI